MSFRDNVGMTFTRTHTYLSFYNPFLVCDQCRRPAPRWHNRDACGCSGAFWNMPCRHVAGVTSVCPSWSPVDGCQCWKRFGSVGHSPPPAADNA